MSYKTRSFTFLFGKHNLLSAMFNCLNRNDAGENKSLSSLDMSECMSHKQNSIRPISELQIRLRIRSVGSEATLAQAFFSRRYFYLINDNIVALFSCTVV